MEDEGSLFDKIRRTFSGRTEDAEQAEEEILTMVNEGHEQGLFEEREAELIRNIFGYKEKEAQDIMTHRKNIVAIDGAQSPEEAMSFILDQCNSRLPVYEEDIDNIVGIIHLRDAMKCYCDEDLKKKPIRELEPYIRPASFVPETKGIDKLFRQMQEEKNHLVIVLDEYGQTTGLVAMEDILEEIVGNILDEYDEEQELVVLQPDGSYLVDGMTHLEDLEEILDIEFGDDDNDTLNGFMVMLLEHIPVEGETVILEYEGYRFEAVSVDNNVIQTVRVRKKDKIEKICEM